VPSYHISVEKKKGLTDILPTTAAPVKAAQETQAKPNNQVPAVQKPTSSIAWWMVFVAFVSGMLAMYLLSNALPKIWRKKGGYHNESQALQILYAHISEYKEL